MSNSVKSWCDACQVAFERTGYGCDGHPMCAKPVAPEGHRLTGDKELTDTGWREDVIAVNEHKVIAGRGLAQEYEKAIGREVFATCVQIGRNGAGGVDVDPGRYETRGMSAEEAAALVRDIEARCPGNWSTDLERTEAWLVGFRGQPCRPGMSMLDWANGVSHARLVLERAAVTFAELPSSPEASS